MMVVMLILSIVLAAMAPVMTTRNKTEQSSPWKYSEGNLSDAYYGLGESQTAMIGQREFETTDETAKLIINSTSARPSQIAFKRNGSNQGLLRLSDSSILLGSLSDAGNLGVYSVGLGSGVNTSNYSVALGRFSDVLGDYSTALGHSSAVGGTHSIAIGYEAKANTNDSIALGNGSQSIELYGTAVGRNSTVSGAYGTAIGGSSRVSYEGGTAIGYSSEASSSTSTALGYNSMASGSQSTALGSGSDVTGLQSTAVGVLSKASGEHSTAVGVASEASGNYSTAIGHNSQVLDEFGTALGIGSVAGLFSTSLGAVSEADNNYATALGYASKAAGQYSTAIGEATEANGVQSTAVGTWATANGENNTAIGHYACRYVTGSNVTCLGANSGPENSDMSSRSNIVYLGSSSSTVYIPGNLVVDGDVILARGSNSSVVLRVSDQDDNDNPTKSKMSICESEDWNGDDDNFDEYNSGRVYHSDFFNTYLSDRRLKYVGKENSSGLDKIRELKVFNYTFKKDKKKTPHVGVIAQDLQKIFPDAVTKGKDGFLRIRMEDMFYAVINAIKELDAKVSAQDKKIKELEARIEKLEAKLK